MKRSPKLGLPSITLRRNGQQLQQQLYHALRKAIANGTLLPGSRLPASRVTARMLGVSRNTVLAAYETLSLEGLITGRTGSGTRVCANPARLLRILARSHPEQLRRLRESGFPLDQHAFRDPDGHGVYIHK